MHYLSQRLVVQTAQGYCLLFTLLNKHHVSCLLECPHVSQSPVHSLLGSASVLRVALVSFKVLLSAWYKGKYITYSSHIRVVVVVWEITVHLSLKITYSNILSYLQFLALLHTWWKATSVSSEHLLLKSLRAYTMTMTLVLAVVAAGIITYLMIVFTQLCLSLHSPPSVLLENLTGDWLFK